MNEIVNQFLLARDKFMPELHLKQPGFTSFLIKSLVEVVLLLPKQIISLQMSFIGRLLKNLRDEKFIHRLKTILEVLI